MSLSSATLKLLEKLEEPIMARQPKQAVVEVPSPTVLGKSLFQRIASYLDENDWNFSAYEDKNYFDLRCRLDDTSVRVIIDVFESDDWQRVLVYSVFPVYAPVSRRSAIAESLTRINYGMRFGNLEMDFSDGEIRVRTIIEAESAMSNVLIERALQSNIKTANQFFAQIMAVAFPGALSEKVLDDDSKPENTTLQ
jgi:hypothetical protein